VILVIGLADVTRPPERGFQIRREIADGDLHVNDVLGRQPRHCCRADVIDPQGQRPQRCLQRAGEGREFVGPFRAVGDDNNRIDGFHSPLL